MILCKGKLSHYLQKYGLMQFTRFAHILTFLCWPLNSNWTVLKVIKPILLYFASRSRKYTPEFQANSFHHQCETNDYISQQLFRHFLLYSKPTIN